jgi:hypothetical protein
MNPAEPGVLGGGCLCGAVRYEVRSTKREGYYCHCRMCQLAFGNTRAAFVNLPRDEVHWLAEPRYHASSKIARRGFCGHCGTPLAFEYLDSKNMDLAVGSFDDPSQFRPTSHFAIESRIAQWHAEDGLPGQRLDAFKPIVDRWRSAYGEAVVPGVVAARGR